MKCIKAIKTSKTIEVGTIQRVDDVEAEARVKSTYWIYISKSEWKATQPKEEPKVEKPAKTISDSVAYGYGLKDETISEKQLKRKKSK